MEDLKANTEYTGYTVASPVVQWFWEVVQAFSKEDMARLLQFITGTSKVRIPCNWYCLLLRCNHLMSVWLIISNTQLFDIFMRPPLLCRFLLKGSKHCKESLVHRSFRSIRPMGLQRGFHLLTHGIWWSQLISWIDHISFVIGMSIV